MLTAAAQLWTLINFLPVPTSKAAAEQRKLQAEYLAVRREMNATSSQDEFAKWAKLRRKHDKLLEQLETTSTYTSLPSPPPRDIHIAPTSICPALASTIVAADPCPRACVCTEKSLETARSRFDSTLTALRLLITRAPQYIIPFWYATEPMFWLPYGWFPYYAEWIISFPRAPLGSVSIASWQLACTGIVTLLRDLLTFVFKLLLGAKQPEAPVPAPGAEKSKDTSTTTEEKKTS